MKVSQKIRLLNSKREKVTFLDLEGLNKLTKEHQNNPIIGYLNINKLRNKINDLRKICRKTQIHVLCIDETELDQSFPDAQFPIEGYQYPAFRKDCNKNGGGKNVHVKEGLIAKRILKNENANIETICTEITISKIEWCLTFAYSPPYNNNKASFFMNLNESLCNIARKHENMLIIGDLNINFGNLKMGDTHSHMSDLCDTLLLSNLVNDVTCVKSQNDISIDVMLTNRPRSFHNTSLIETGLSDCHKMIISVFKAFFKRLPANVIEYQDNKTFDQNEFL